MNMAFLFVGASPGRTTEYGLHSHDCYEIIINTEGEGSAEIGGKTYPFFPGAVHVIPPNMPHFKAAPGGFRDLYIRMDSLSKKNELLRDPLILADDACHTLTNLTTSLLSRYLLQKEDDLVASTLFSAILQIIEESTSVTPVSPVISQVIQSITASYSDPEFQVTEVLTATGYSKDHLRRCFQQATGMTPHEYLTDIRIRYAKRLLSQKLPVGEAALLSGYYDPDYFCRLFRAKTGATPTAYQKSCAKEETKCELPL